VAAATFLDTDAFVVQLNRMRVNPTILRTNTWADMGALSADWTQWIAPDQRCQSTDARITSFVQQSLPANYQSTLTPYDTARTLHRAVMKQLTYQSPPLHLDAVGVLQDGVADCGGFAALLTACLRNVGIPARCISGFRQGDGVWHVRVEFHLPGGDWLVADPTDGNANDPTGTYAYDFGDVPNADSFVAVDVGDAHVRPYNTFQFIQVPNWWWSGGATFNSRTVTSYLQPFVTTLQPFVITGIAPEGNDMLITWQTMGGSTDSVQVSSSGGNGGYTNSFSDLSSLIGVIGNGAVTTNYLDIGGATNTLTRFYRVRQIVTPASDNATDSAYSGG
jgi:hypothetical protein